MREAPAAEEADEFDDECDGERGGEDRQNTKREQRVTERLREPRRERDERWLIDVTPREMLRAGDEVQLVPEVTVAARRRDVQNESEKRER